MQRRRAILHIGTEKTGTTSLQASLDRNRDALLRRGVLFPRCLGPVNHTVLVAAAQDDGYADRIKTHLLAQRNTTEAALRRTLADDLVREMEAASDWHTLVISSELIHSRLHTASEVDRLLSFFHDAVDEIVVMVVLRRQDKLAVSRFSTAVRSGLGDFDAVFWDIADHAFVRIPPGRSIDDMVHYYDFAVLIDRFAQVLGDAAMRVHLYEEDGTRLDPFAALCVHLAIDARDLDLTVNEFNPAISAEAQYVLAALNRRFPMLLPDGRRDWQYSRLKRRVETEVTGQRREVARADARAFAARFDASNEAVRARFFPRRATLFDDDFGMYPDKVDYSGFHDRLSPVVEAYVEQMEAETRDKAARRKTSDKLLKRTLLRSIASGLLRLTGSGKTKG